MNKFFYLLPRVLGIIFILFLVVFSLDVFIVGATFLQIISGLFIHNIPVLILLLALIIFRKTGIITGLFFIAFGLFFIKSLIIFLPAFLIGFLFLINRSPKTKK